MKWHVVGWEIDNGTVQVCGGARRGVAKVASPTHNVDSNMRINKLTHSRTQQNITISKLDDPQNA